jgi:hypothetical protein
MKFATIGKNEKSSPRKQSVGHPTNCVAPGLGAAPNFRNELVVERLGGGGEPREQKSQDV